MSRSARRALLPGLVGAAAFLTAVACRAAAENPCETATSSAVLAEDGEPGQKLRVRGVLYRPDGVTPAAGVIVYAYQTDATGRYATFPSRTPRIRGWMRTDADGRFEFLTIRPGNYPDRRTEAHIHTELWGPEAPPQWGTDLNFADDDLLSDAKRRKSEGLGKFAFVKSPAKDGDGVAETTWNIRLKEKGDFFGPEIRHGVDPCGVDAPRQRP